MEWTDFQLNSDGPGDSALLGTGHLQRRTRRSRRVSRSTAIWNVTPNFVLEGSVTPRRSGVLRGDAASRRRAGGSTIETARRCRSRRSGNTGHRPSTRLPNFLAWDGDLWTRCSYSYQSDTWKDIDAAVDPGSAIRIIPSWSTSNLQFGFTHNSGWEAALIVRNLFDEKGVNWLSSYDLRRVLRRSALPVRPHTAAAAHGQPVVHQEMVTRRGMG